MWVDEMEQQEEKQLPFGQNTKKEDKGEAQNIEGHSVEVGQHARTSGI